MRKMIPVVFCLLFVAALGCEDNDLGRYCIVGQPVPEFKKETYGQPSVTILNIEAPECIARLCLQQGPFKLHPEAADGTDPLCQPPYISSDIEDDDGNKIGTRCIYPVKAMCSKKCKKHSDCSPGPQEANGEECAEYVCHKQAEGEAFAGNCICVCKDFLIDPDTEPPAFYDRGKPVPEPTNCN